MPAQFSEHLEAALPAAGVTVLPRGRHWGFYGGTIITADDRVLIDVSRDVWQWPGHTVRTRFKLPRCRPLPLPPSPSPPHRVGPRPRHRQRAIASR